MDKDVLVLGGTGAMGVPLVNQLMKTDNVYVTTRRSITSNINNTVKYIKGNAKHLEFLKEILSQRHWDAIVDFMVWSGAEFEQVVPMMLEATGQYVFISSVRVYAQNENPISEDSPRLLDVSTDLDYLKTNEYALAKAREEDLLLKSGKKNFTIVRPTITYNNDRLQLGVFEKENWLYRVLHGRSIVFSNDIADKITTMTHGDDVAKGIASIVGKENAKGEVYNITSQSSLRWSDVMEIYLSVLERYIGHRPNVVMTDKTTNLQFKDRKYQVIYCRYFNRSFDNSKINFFCNTDNFIAPQEGLANCLQQFLLSPKFSWIDWKLEGINDRVAGEKTPLGEIEGISNKLYYLAYRYRLIFLLPLIKIAGFLHQGVHHQKQNNHN